MNFKVLRQLFSLRDLRNALLAAFVVLGGLGLAVFTLWAHRSGNVRAAGIAAGMSLIFVLLILIFVVPPLARNASAEASQMNLPFEFTSGGAIYLGLIVIVGFSAWNTGNNLLFLVLSFLTAALIVGFFAGNFCLKKLDVKMRFPETIFAGQETPILVSLHNRKFLFPSYSIVAEVRGKEREKSLILHELKKILPVKIAEKMARPPIVKHTLDYFIHLPRRRTVENKAEHIFRNRGRFIIKDFELSTKFPFGFFRHRRRLPAQSAELIVFPRLSPLSEETENLPLDIGKLVVQKRGMGQDLLSMRDYQPMDDLRRVDWKATARANRLIVREFSAEDERRVTVFLDTRLPEPAEDEKTLTLRERVEAEREGNSAPVSEKFEKGVSITASILSFFTDEQAEIRLVIDSEIGEFGIGKEHLHKNLKRLALIEPNFDENAELDAEKLDEIFTEKENSYTFFISAADESNLPKGLMQKAKFVGF
ncbi:MAG: DUF58 domain-containing protein [Pyrinomonadaceae bacterium]|nr:DUF58 domain-containing protein [Pyrinomonadaceae bacterium]